MPAPFRSRAASRLRHEMAAMQGIGSVCEPTYEIRHEMKAFKKLTQLRKIGIPLSRHVSFLLGWLAGGLSLFHSIALRFCPYATLGTNRGTR
jgi:hypothetical protein